MLNMTVAKAVTQRHGDHSVEEGHPTSGGFDSAPTVPAAAYPKDYLEACRKAGRDPAENRDPEVYMRAYLRVGRALRRKT